MLYLGMEGIGLLLTHGKVPFLLSLPVLIRCACARLLPKKKQNLFSSHAWCSVRQCSDEPGLSCFILDVQRLGVECETVNLRES